MNNKTQPLKKSKITPLNVFLGLMTTASILGFVTIAMDIIDMRKHDNFKKMYNPDPRPRIIGTYQSAVNSVMEKLKLD